LVPGLSGAMAGAVAQAASETAAAERRERVSIGVPGCEAVG
jgi:hypothetical protein